MFGREFDMSWYRYLPLAMPDPRKFINFDTIVIDECVSFNFHDERRRMVRQLHIRPHSQKEIRWVRQVLDYHSNVRRRKRWSELDRRRRTPPTAKGG